MSDSLESKINAYSQVKDWYCDYGEYVNSTRALPGIDGLKSVQRRLLWAMHNLKVGSFIKSATIVGECIGKYHSHGDSSTYNALCNMVNKGTIIGQGNWGQFLMENLSEAAMRYTEAKLDKKVDSELFKFIDYCDIVESEISGFVEPRYLIVKIPIALMTGSKGVGIATASNIPAFTPESLIKAYESDNYNKLKIKSEGLQVIKANYESLWNEGVGSVTYLYKVEKQWSKIDNSEIVLIEGNGHIFKPRIYTGFSSWILQGLAWYRDESTKNIRLVIGKSKGIKRISIDDIYNKALSISSKTIGYRINIYDSINRRVIQLGIKEWLHRSFEIHKNTHDRYVNDTFEKYLNQIKILYKSSEVINLLLQGKSDFEIMRVCKITKDQIKEVEDMPLRNRKSEVIQKKIDNIIIEMRKYKQSEI